VSQGKAELVQDWRKCLSICLYMCTCPTIRTDGIRNYTATLKIPFTWNFLITHVRFKLFLGNWTTNRF